MTGNTKRVVAGASVAAAVLALAWVGGWDGGRGIGSLAALICAIYLGGGVAYIPNYEDDKPA
ncbi:MAG: hypothetical protein A3E01_04650 [Gammaproteobacteria bacterium RIFCSPHIGHO2_12_FULL_63_22]|nr:MAG: hypothetical protein A3E01_04650 [Gammaproteobacteria bacterium RIFCSPHIGHO2_12_FULL_63_22]